MTNIPKRWYFCKPGPYLWNLLGPNVNTPARSRSTRGLEETLWNERGDGACTAAREPTERIERCNNWYSLDCRTFPCRTENLLQHQAYPP
eukprot:9382119-Pyramimonas_sp.AAC.1